MIFTEIKLKGAFIVEPEPHTDERGLFARTFCQDEFKAVGLDKPFVQINHSVNHTARTLRGLHYQVEPFVEAKLIRCIAGKVFDVIVDLRKKSDTYLQYFGIDLSEKNMKMIYVPEGFAHGFVTLENNTQLIYHHTAFYKPGFEAGIRYNDPRLNIDWPVEPAIISEKDKNIPLLDASFSGL
jgi:dTDP-4-dehydrorhamnose 3,5-epimerase